MIVCTKPFAIEVVQSILFSWGAGTIDPGPGSASFTPTSADGNTTLGSVTVPNAGVGAAVADNVGSFILNTNAIIPANMNITVASVGTNPDPDLTASISVFVVAPFASLVFVNAGAEIGYNNTVDFPFNFPDTGGANWTIQWAQSAVAIANPTGGSISIAGILTLV